MLPSKTEHFDRRIATRNILVKNIQGIQFWLERLNAFKTPERMYNMYYSMAKFKTFPMRDPKTFELEIPDWNEKAYRFIIGYDMLIDIDGGDNDIDYAVDSAKRIKARLDGFNVPYHMRFSGRGFHFIIPSRFFVPELLETDNVNNFNPHKDDNIYSLMRKIAEYLYDVDSEFIDRDVYDHRRVAKIPYSLAIYDDNVFICKPVKDLNDFKIESYLLQNNKDLKIEGDTLHNSDGNTFALIKEVLKNVKN